MAASLYKDLGGRCSVHSQCLPMWFIGAIKDFHEDTVQQLKDTHSEELRRQVDRASKLEALCRVNSIARFLLEERLRRDEETWHMLARWQAELHAVMGIHLHLGPRDYPDFYTQPPADNQCAWLERKSNYCTISLRKFVKG